VARTDARGERVAIRIDLGILDLIERCCRRFQTLTGRTNIWLAAQITNLSIIVYFVVCAVVYFLSVDVAPRLLIIVFATSVLYGLTQTIFKVPIEASETQAYRRVAKMLRNPRRIQDQPLRLSFLTLSAVLLLPVSLAYVGLHLFVVLLAYSLIVLTTLVLYLLACDPLPPCAGTLRVWSRNMASARRAPASDLSSAERTAQDARRHSTAA
jgi:hypothetical protein